MTVSGAPTFADIEAAREKVTGRARVTPIYGSETLSRLTGRKTWLKADPLRDAVLAKLRTAKSLASDGGDIEVSYGEYDIAARLDAPARRYVFVNIWDVGKTCRLAVESLNPAR